jgi:2,5-diketo-D-gluconate reductase A
MTTIPTVTLQNGTVMPQLGLGVYQAQDGDQVEQAVLAAIDAGYRSIDTASLYRNESGVGNAIKKASVPRQELFVTTKLWNADQGYDSTLKAFDESLSKLGLDYIDLYLIHWPAPEKDLYVDTWRALEKLYKDGKVKAIGVSNFFPEHLERLKHETDIFPVINQVELHPSLQQRNITEYCEANNIAVEAWSPIGGPGSEDLKHPIIADLSERYNKSPAQIVLRWHIQHGRVVIPKSVHAERIQENADIFDFELSADDIAAIDAMDQGEDGRIGPHPLHLNG